MNRLAEEEKAVRKVRQRQFERIINAAIQA
jgi:hypothetical protein